ncbi:MAG: hypothetical protein AB1757_27120 [Acidobacteriota bacterium]
MKKITIWTTALMIAISVAVVSLAAKPAAQTGIDLLNVLPDGKGAVVIDVQKVVTSSLFTQEKLKNLLDKAQNEIAHIGLNISDFNAVAISFPAAGLSNPTIAISGTLNQNTILAQLRDKPNVKVESEKYKGFDIQKVTEVSKPDANGKAAVNINNSTAFVFFDSNTTVVSSLAGVRAAIDARGGERPSLAKNTEITGALSQNPTAPISFALQMDANAAKGLANNSLPLPNFDTLKLVFGAVELTNGVGINATLRSDNAEHAKAMADQLTGLVGMVKGFLSASNDPKLAPLGDALKNLTVTTIDADVKINGTFPMELISQFLK